ncbi:TonB-dependent receptor plug domain-containing protein [Endozoicomonas arenosclerae]|uniref:TonB-dependent receptor plug domain-containing protein n=1 Tax=Endozoicomonas arenosclerae TaxID=1633495 RepID=UPI000784C51A|nr:TonB-dependent receptor [Endozoicomonas arenosclerae]
MKTNFLPTLLASCIFASSQAFAESPEEEDLFDLSLEELISMEIPDVTSVSRKKQRLMDSAAAIYVITNEDLRRTGVTSIPEALRMVPGMQVAKLNANTWSISTRGFNYIFANKLLVLIDGRTVYSPLFSGVNWDVQDTMMEDIDRIEVIRGPGAALWGANAVNGVINIITKKAADTQGNLLTAGGGTEEKAFGAFRHGGEFGETGFYRVYVKAFERDGQVNAEGKDTADDWKMRRAGFKSEWKVSSDSEMTVQGELYEGTTRPPLRLLDKSQPTIPQLANGFIVNGLSRDQRGGNLGAYWKRTLSETHDYSLRAIYDNYQNFDYRIAEKRDTIDLEFQHYSQLWGRHDLVWGLGYRATWYEVKNTPFMYLLEGKDSKQTELFSAFIQDDITLNDQWTFTLSSRFEHNSFTGYEVQPNARLTWRPSENRTFWAALSRAVKTPSISETALQTDGITIETPSTVSYIIPIMGNPDLKSEKLTALELGYREQFGNNFRLDITAFYNQYEDIIAYVDTNMCPNGSNAITIPSATGSSLYLCPYPNVVQLPATLINGLNTKTYGLEVVADWQAKDWWKLQFTYSWLQVDAWPNQAKTDFLNTNERIVEDLSAPHTANIRSTMNLPNQWYFDFWVRYSDNLKNANIGANTSLDIRLAKKYGDNLEFSLVGQNLFRDHHREFYETLSGMAPTEIQESWYAQIRWQF